NSAKLSPRDAGFTYNEKGIESASKNEKKLEASPKKEEVEPKGPHDACLFVASLSRETKEESLKKYFSHFGTVLKVKVLKDRSQRPDAFVQFQVFSFQAK